ncbi:unnamed protein product, partial [Vitis vinifera]
MSWCRSSDPVTCIIADGIMGFAIDVGNEVGVPTISFRTSSPCAFWAYFSLPQLIEAGEVPFKDDDMDQLVTSVPGMEGFLRRRDLPSFCRTKDANDPNLQLVMIETRQTPRADALILNTFEDLDGATLSQIRSHCPKLYTIGPLHAHLKSRLASETTASHLTVITKEELMEFWHGLVNSGSRFLWVIRPDSLTEKDGEFQPPAQLWEVTKERGQIVGWVPQEEVLAHPAVGGHVWKLGMDMKDTCDRVTIEKMVRDLMEKRRTEFTKSAEAMAKLARSSLSEGGSSYCNFSQASVVNDVCELNHGVYVALEGQWEEHSSATLSLLQFDFC